MIEIQEITPTNDYFEQYHNLRMRIINIPFGIPTTTLHEEQEKADSQIILVAIEKNEVVGCVNLREERFGGLAVKKNKQRQGIGKKLVAKCEEIFKKQGKQEISCYAHESSYEYYKKLGYKEQGKREVFGKHKSIPMEKSL